MKPMSVVKQVTAVAAAACLLAVQAPPANAHHRPDAYCSPSGDICQSTAKVDGERRLQIRTFAKYFSRYRVCVEGPDDSTTCRRFRIERSSSHSYVSSIVWRKHFPDGGAGSHTVRWFAQGRRVGATLGFHR